MTLYPSAQVFPQTPTPPSTTLPYRTVELDGLRIGAYLEPYELTDINFGGKPEGILGDVPRPRADGIFFGRDRLSGRIITLEGSIATDNYADCSAAWGALNRVWDNERDRTRSGALVPLRIRAADGAARRVFGRPRNLDPKDDPGFKQMDRGRIDFVATFQCVDQFFYSDEENTNTIGLQAPVTSGLREPLREPLSTKGSTKTLPGDVIVIGDAPAWLVATVTGPITLPKIEVVGEWSITIYGSLAYDQFVTVNATPWDRSIRLNGSAPISGAVTADSRRLSNARLDPGPHEVVLRGESAEGTASLTVNWRDAFLSP